jgi:hypothetical protein
MNGLFNLSLRDAGGFSDEDFKQASRRGKLEEMLDGLEVQQDGITANTVLNWVAHDLWPYAFVKHMTSPWSNSGNACGPTGDRPFYDVGADTCVFDSLVITDDATEPAVDDAQCGFYDYNAGAIRISSGAWKFFLNEDVGTTQVWSDGDGRQAVHYRTRFLFLPSEAVANSIRSINIYAAEGHDNSGGAYRGLVARARLKDAGGTPITISKTANQVLLVDYTFSLVSV